MQIKSYVTFEDLISGMTQAEKDSIERIMTAIFGPPVEIAEESTEDQDITLVKEQT